MAQGASVLDYALQLARAGTSSVLACGVGTAVDAAARIGFYADTTGGAEQLAFVVGAQTGPIFTRSGSSVNLTVNGSVNGGAATFTTGTFTGLLLTVLSATGGAGFRLPHGAAPTSPVNGDIWTTTAGLFARINGATVGPMEAGGGSALTATYVGYGDGSNALTGEAAFAYNDTTNTLTIENTTGVTVAVSGQFTSTLATGTAPFVVASTTVVANLNVSKLLGQTWADPGAIGGGTPAAVTGTTVTGSTALVGGTVSGTTATFSSLTSGRVPYVTTAGLLTDAAGFRFDGTNLSLGSAGALTTFNGTTSTPKFQVYGSGTAATSIGIAGFTTQPILYLSRSAGATGVYTAVAAGDSCGEIRFEGADGTDFARAALIQTLVDTGATVSDGVVPGRLTFRTTDATGAQALAFSVDSQQVLVVGSTTAKGSTLFNGGGTTPALQILSTSGAGAIGLARYVANTGSTSLYFAKSRAAAVGGLGVVTTGDSLGTIFFAGDDGTNLVNAASIAVTCTGTIGTGQVPGLMAFKTATSAGTLTTAGQIDSTQALVWGGAFTSTSMFSAGTLRPHVQTAATSTANANMAQSIWINSTAGSTQIMAKSRSTTVGTPGVITTGDTLGTMSWQGDDGTNFIEAARIVGASTGTIGTGQVPGTLTFATATAAGSMTNALRIDSTQVIVVMATSTAASSALYTGGTITPQIQVVGNSSGVGATGASINHFRAGTSGGALYFGKSRSSTVGTMTIVTTGDTLGGIDWQGSDGTNFVSAATITVAATGTVGANQIPGLMTFSTATSAGTVTAAMTINSAQMTTVTSLTDSALTSTRITYAGASGLLSDDANFTSTNGSTTSGGFRTISNTTASSSTSTGALVVSGGVGIGGSCVIGGNLNYSGVLTGATATPTASGTIKSLSIGLSHNPVASSSAVVENYMFSRLTTSQNMTATRGLVGCAIDVIHGGASTITGGVGVLVQMTTTAAGTYTNAYHINVLSPTVFAGATFTTVYGLKIEDQSAGGTNYAIYTGTGIVHVGDTLEHADATNVTFGTGTGTKFGTATSQKLAFYNATPIIQPAGATQAALAAYSTGVFGLDSNANMQALYDLVVAMRTALLNLGLIKGAA